MEPFACVHYEEAQVHLECSVMILRFNHIKMISFTFTYFLSCNPRYGLSFSVKHNNNNNNNGGYKILKY